MTYREAYQEGIEKLRSAQIEEALLDARILLLYATRTDMAFFYAHGDEEVDPLFLDLYRGLLDRRSMRIPLQHILHRQDFMGLSFYVDEHVLIPRADTEILVEEVMRHHSSGIRILDMCTGSGCILISLLHYINEAQGVGCDLSEEALQVARKNAQQLQVDASFYQGDLFDALGDGETFDVIVSNPPYIETDVIGTLSPEVRDHDPYMALHGGSDGLDFYRRIVRTAPGYLRKCGELYLEIGYNQAEAVRNLCEKAGFSNIEVIKDLSGLDRVVRAELI